MATISDKKNPSWWTEKHSSSWNRVKEAFSRDWEQTKADFSKESGHELNQNVGDTVKQAAGKEYIPPSNIPNDKPDDDYESAEPALRYGYGAANYFSDFSKWDPTLETKLRGDWDTMKSGRDWDSVKNQVRSGWERARTAKR